MEIFELKYFLGVAETENIHRASERLRVSPASLSKAVSRLEDELGVALFSRDGRNIRLSDHGRLLKKRASEIVALEETTRYQLSGHKGSVHCVLAGPEVLLGGPGLELVEGLARSRSQFTFELRAAAEVQALEWVRSGQAQLAVSTSDAPKDLASKTLGEAEFQTCVGPGHPLFAAAKARKSLPIEQVLEHAFVSPSYPFLGQVGLKQSVDGWRDDQFPRKVEYVTSSLKLLETLVSTGRALAYLPDYHAASLPVLALKISGCPYSCKQKLRLLARDPKSRGWLNQLF